MNEIIEERHLNVFGADVSVFSDGSVHIHRGSRNKRRFGNHHYKGYRTVIIRDNGVERTVFVHRLVANAFIDNPEDKPTVNHLNGVRHDNRVSNLEWATWKEQKNDPLTRENMKRAFAKTDYRAMGAKRNFGRLPITITWADGRVTFTESLLMVSKLTGKSYSKLSEVLHGKRKQYKEFCIAVTKKHFPEEAE